MTETPTGLISRGPWIRSSSRWARLGRACFLRDIPPMRVGIGSLSSHLDEEEEAAAVVRRRSGPSPFSSSSLFSPFLGKVTESKRTTRSLQTSSTARKRLTTSLQCREYRGALHVSFCLSLSQSGSTVTIEGEKTQQQSLPAFFIGTNYLEEPHPPRAKRRDEASRCVPYVDRRRRCVTLSPAGR